MKRPIFVLLLVFVLGEVIAVLKLNHSRFYTGYFNNGYYKNHYKKACRCFCGDFFCLFL